MQKNSVKSKQIKDGQVLTQDLGDGAVAADKLAANAVDASKVGADALGGADVNEATLDGVNAASLGGIAPGGFALADHSHDSAYVNEGQPDAVTAAMMTPDSPRAMQIPLRSFIDCDTDAGSDINFTSGLDTLPGFRQQPR